MPALTYTMPVYDTAPKYTTVEAHEAAVQVVVDDLADRIDVLSGSLFIAGEWAASSGAFPTLRADGSAIQAGDIWYVTDGGAAGGVTFVQGERLLAQRDVPGATYAGNWLQLSWDDYLAVINAAKDLALAGSPYRLPTFAALAARLRYSGATGSQIDVAAGDVVDVPGIGVYTVLASAATGFDLDYTGAGGVKLRVVTGDVRAYGPTATADDAAAVIAAAATGAVHFPKIEGAAATYTAASVTAGSLDGVRVSVDPGVEVDLGFGLTQDITAAAIYDTDVPLPATLQKTRYIALKTLPDYSKNCIPMPQVANFRKQRPVNLSTEVVGRAIEWPSADTFTSAAGTAAANRYTVTATGGEGWRGAFIEIGPWETISGVIENASSQPGNIGVIIRGKDGYAVVYGNTVAAVYTSSRKPTGLAVSETSITWTRLGQSSFSHYAPKKSAWSVTRIDAQRAIVSINGQQLCEAQNVGDIFEMGFVAYNNSGNIVVAGVTIDRRTDMRFAPPRIEVMGIFGDSMGEDNAGSAGRYFKQRLDGLAGLRVDSVLNYAVGGTDLAALITSLTANLGFVDSPYVPIFSGTNDIQALTAIATFETRVQSALDLVTGAGKIPVWVLPWQYYGQAEAQIATGETSQGQNATNHTAGAKYRELLRRLVANAGGVFFDPGFELPYADPSYLVLNPDNPLLRDNIHPDAMAYQLFAIGITQAIADHYLHLPEIIEGSLPAGAFLNGTTGTGLRYAMDKAGWVTLFGSFENSATTDQNVIQLPRWMRPNVAFNVGYRAVGATDPDKSRGVISNTGIVTQKDVPTGANSLILNATFRAAI